MANAIIGIEIEFRGPRPKKLRIRVELEGNSYSRTLSKKDALKWNFEPSLFFARSADVHVVLEEHHLIHKKKELGKVMIKSADIDKNNTSISSKVNDSIELKLAFGVPVEVVEAAQIRIEEAERKLESKTVVLESLGKARGFVDFIMGLGDLVTEIYPAAQSAVTVINYIFEKLKAQEECHELASDLLSTLSSFLPFTATIQADSFKFDNTKHIIGEMLELYKKAGDLIIGYSSQNILGEMIASKKDEISGIKDDFSKARKAFDWCTKLEIWKTALNTEGLGEEQLLRQLGPAEKAYYDPNDACLAGTREPVVTELRQWLNDLDENAPQLYWLHGLHGSGKSAIASTVAKELDSQSYLSGCFFCHRDVPSLRDPEALLPTLSYQLTRWHEPYRKRVVSVLQGNERAKLDSKQLRWQFELLFERPLKHLHFSEDTVPPKPLLIVVDGLDACGDDPEVLVRISDILAQMATLVPWLKVFISSRPDAEIEQGISQAKCPPQIMDLDQFPAGEDIEQYTREWISKIPRIDPLWLSDESIKALCDKAAGRFVWASAIRKFVTDPKRRDKNRALVRAQSMQFAVSPKSSTESLHEDDAKQANGNAEDPKKKKEANDEKQQQKA